MDGPGGRVRLIEVVFLNLLVDCEDPKINFGKYVFMPIL